MSITKAISHKDRLPPQGNFGTGGREYNMTGWHVCPLHHGAQVESIKAHLRCQGVAPLYESPAKLTLKSPTLKLDTPRFVTPQRAPTTPYESLGVTPSPPKSVDTFWRFAFPRVVVTSLMPNQRRFHHEDRTGTPGVPCQPDCG